MSSGEAPLYRPEALAARRVSLLGEVRLHAMPRSEAVAAVVTVILLGVLAFTAMGHYTHRVTVDGTLVPTSGLARVHAPGAGTVVSVSAAEGETVAKGAELLTIRSLPEGIDGSDGLQKSLDTITEQEHIVSSQLTQEEARLQAQIGSLEQQLRHISAEVAEAEAELGLRRSEAALLAKTAEKFESLRNRDFVSSLQVLDKEAAALSRQADTKAAEKALLRLMRERVSLQAELTDSRAALTRSRADAELRLSELRSERARATERAGAMVTAPLDGRVASRLVEPGTSVKSGDLLFDLIPQGGEIQAHLMVDSRAAAAITKGTPVALRLEAFPFERFGHRFGHVVRVSQSPHTEVRGGVGVQLYRIVVALDAPVDLALLPGMKVTADLLLDRRRIISWIFAPAERAYASARSASSDGADQ